MVRPRNPQPDIDIMTNAAEKKPTRVLLAVAEPALLASLEALLRRQGLEVKVATSALALTAGLEEPALDVLLLDLALPGTSGPDLLTTVKLRWPEVEILALTGDAAAETALRGNVYDWLRRPLVDVEQAARAVGRAGERKRLLERVRALESGGGAVAGASLPPPANGEDRAWLGQSYAEAKEHALRRFEKAYVEELMRECGSNISAAARKAGMDRSNFKRVLRKYRGEIEPEGGEKPQAPRSASA